MAVIIIIISGIVTISIIIGSKIIRPMSQCSNGVKRVLLVEGVRRTSCRLMRVAHQPMNCCSGASAEWVMFVDDSEDVFDVIAINA